ncbi:hypothetical protein D3C78_1406940 [compost metagenome]
MSVATPPASMRSRMALLRWADSGPSALSSRTDGAPWRAMSGTRVGSELQAPNSARHNNATAVAPAAASRLRERTAGILAAFG